MRITVWTERGTRVSESPDDAQIPGASSTGDEIDVDEQESAREVLSNHDPLGLDLAAQVAEGTRSILPAPRGVGQRPRRRRRRQWVDGTTRSGSGPDARDPQTVQHLLDRLIDERGWTREINLRHLLDRWDALVGQATAEHSHPEGYKDTVLTVRCDSTAWATQLRMLAPSLVAKLNERLGQGTVTRINILGPSAPSWRHGPRTVRDGRGPRDTYG